MLLIIRRMLTSPNVVVDVLLEAIRNTVKDASSPHLGKELLV
jgi:hypothetical protein